MVEKQMEGGSAMSKSYQRSIDARCLCQVPTDAQSVMHNTRNGTHSRRKMRPNHIGQHKSKLTSGYEVSRADYFIRTWHDAYDTVRYPADNGQLTNCEPQG
jgi:hypothetical protein